MCRSPFRKMVSGSPLADDPADAGRILRQAPHSVNVGRDAVDARFRTFSRSPRGARTFACHLGLLMGIAFAITTSCVFRPGSAVCVPSLPYLFGWRSSVMTRKRGFASMDAARQRAIASKGGRAAHEKGTAHEFTSEEARAAGP